MALRYLVRRSNPSDLNSIKKDIQNLDTSLPKPQADYKESLEVFYSPVRSAFYSFATKKVGDTWTWVCPCIEYVAENEEGLFEVLEKAGIKPPAHLL